MCKSPWLIVGWLIGWLVGWLVGWLIDWLIGWLVDWLVGWLAGWLTGWLVGWLIDWLDGWLIGWLDGCLIGWLDGNHVGWLFDWLVGAVRILRNSNIFLSNVLASVYTVRHWTQLYLTFPTRLWVYFPPASFHTTSITLRMPVKLCLTQKKLIWWTTAAPRTAPNKLGPPQRWKNCSLLFTGF